jgi:hypothetical protein
LIVLAGVVTATIVLYSLPAPEAAHRLRSGAALKRARTDNSLFEESSLQPHSAERPHYDGKGACRLSGMATDQAGHPVANRGIWVEASTLDALPYAQLPEPYGPSPATFTDSEGRYAIEGLAAGVWMVGPSAEARRTKSADAIAPVGSLVEVPADCTGLARDLHLFRGLYIRGSIVDPRGERVAEGFVNATSPGALSTINDVGKPNGTFVVGPLVPGRYRLRAGAATDYCDSPEVEASPGDEGVVLTLRPGGAVAGMLEDAATGDVCQARLTLSGSSKDGSQIVAWESHDSGDFNLDRLEPGTYDICARTGERKAGIVRAVKVREGETVEGLRIRLEPGCVVRVKCGRAGSLTLMSNGTVVAKVFVDVDGVLVDVLPAGPSSVHFAPFGGAAPEDRDLDLRVGEEKEVVFGGN